MKKYKFILEKDDLNVVDFIEKEENDKFRHFISKKFNCKVLSIRETVYDNVALYSSEGYIFYDDVFNEKIIKYEIYFDNEKSYNDFIDYINSIKTIIKINE